MHLFLRMPRNCRPRRSRRTCSRTPAAKGWSLRARGIGASLAPHVDRQVPAFQQEPDLPRTLPHLSLPHRLPLRGRMTNQQGREEETRETRAIGKKRIGVETGVERKIEVEKGVERKTEGERRREDG